MVVFLWMRDRWLKGVGFMMDDTVLVVGLYMIMDDLRGLSLHTFV